MDLHYNAFISYRHHPEDIKVAETIHRSLERFKVPKALKQQGKSIERIFRDKEELPITSSLTDTITMALRNSDYQIVICSTHLKDSYWVQREIETFLQTHTKDKVLTVLVDGDNPYDVIPEILTYNEVVDPVTGEITREPIEPLSCDWRMPKRKAMKTELPRLAAVLLGCTYDDLIQRQKQYRQRRLIAGISTGMAASLALAGYFLYTSIQIQENLNQSLRNQSQYLASAAQEKFDSGDRLSAIALAMAALPSEENPRPYVPSAELALTKALMLYDASGDLISVASFDAESSIEAFVVTDDGKTIYILNDQYTVTVWDTYEQKKLSSFNIVKTQLMNPTLITDNHSNLLTLGGDEGKTLMCFSKEGALLWQEDNIEDIAFCEGKNTLLATRRVEYEDWTLPTTCQLLHLNPENGALLKDSITIEGTDGMSYPSFVADTYYEGQPVAIDVYLSAINHIIIVDPETGKSRDVLAYDAFFHGGSVTEDNRLYVLTTVNEDVNNGRLGNFYFYTKGGAYLYCFDMETGRQLWRTDITAYNYSEANTVAPIPNTDRVFCQHGSAFLQVDAKTGKILEECHATTIPLTIQMRETTAWVLFTNGCTSTYNFSTNTIGYTQYMDNGLLLGHNNKGIYVVPQLSSSVLLYRSTNDDSYEVLSGEYDDFIYEMTAAGDYLVTSASNVINLFDLPSRSLLWQYECGYSNYLLGFSSDLSTLYTRKYSAIKQYNTATGEMTEWELLPSDEFGGYGMYYNCIKYANDTICCMLYPYGSSDAFVLFYDCIAKTYDMHPFRVEEDMATSTAYGGTPIILDVTPTHALIRTGSGALYFFDRSTELASLMTDQCPDNPVMHKDTERDRMVFRTNDGILITDLSGTPLQTIPLTDQFAVSFYFYEDQLLFLGSDAMIHRYDLDGNLLGVVALSVYSQFFGECNSINSQNVPITWNVSPNGELIVNVLRLGNIIDTENWERTCDVDQLVLYHEGTDSYICQSDDMIYAYDRLSMDEILQRAQEELHGFELSDRQKEYFGLN